ncbi:hypothetical protein ACFCZ3_20180 [Cellulosimicrobium cellulans]|uniref:hypothetical protein n=1 Tax=Cellulosimicrobium cellulans TaxID=1710 RepID=UPI0035DCA347
MSATATASTGTWFDRLFSEFSDRNEAMFAFSRKQVEEKGVTWDDYQAGWVSVGAGLHVKRTAVDEFLRRMDADHEADQATLPELRVRYTGGTDSWDRPVYRDENGRRLVDINYSKPNEAEELHTVSHGEPVSAVRARLVFLTN